MASARHMNPPPAMVAKPQFSIASNSDNLENQIVKRNRYQNAFKSLATGALATSMAFGIGSNVANAEI